MEELFLLDNHETPSDLKAMALKINLFLSKNGRSYAITGHF